MEVTFAEKGKTVEGGPATRRAPFWGTPVKPGKKEKKIEKSAALKKHLLTLQQDGELTAGSARVEGSGSHCVRLARFRLLGWSLSREAQTLVPPMALRF